MIPPSSDSLPNLLVLETGLYATPIAGDRFLIEHLWTGPRAERLLCSCAELTALAAYHLPRPAEESERPLLVRAYAAGLLRSADEDGPLSAADPEQDKAGQDEAGEDSPGEEDQRTDSHQGREGDAALAMKRAYRLSEDVFLRIGEEGALVCARIEGGGKELIELDLDQGAARVLSEFARPAVPDAVYQSLAQTLDLERDDFEEGMGYFATQGFLTPVEGRAPGQSRPAQKPVLVTSVPFPGVSAAFRHLARVLPDLVRFEPFSRDLEPGRALTLFGVWHRRYTPFLIDLPGRRGISVHSSLGQIELSDEFALMERIFSMLAEDEELLICTSSDELAQQLRVPFGAERVFWLPDTVDATLFDGVPAMDLGEGFHVDGFMPGHHRKNILTQAMAVGQVGGTLHVGRFIADHPAYLPYLDRFGVAVEDHGYVPDGAYWPMVKAMDVGIQCSFAESFCYYAVERMLLEVPVLGTTIVPAMDFHDALLQEHLIVRDPSSVTEMAERLERLRVDADLRHELGRRCRIHALELAQKHARIARDTIEAMLA